MKRYLSVLLFLVIFIVGCANENTPNNENVNESQKENGENEVLEQEEVQNENTYVYQQFEVLETSTEINIGESAFFIFPETDFGGEKRLEFMVHGIDYLSEIDIEGKVKNEQFYFLVLDFEVKNIGEVNVSPTTYYPEIIIHNNAGHQLEFDLTTKNGLESHTFEYVDIIPGGHSRGLVILAFEKGEEIDSLYFDSQVNYPDESQPPFVLNIDEVSKTATETATQTYEQLELRREEFLKDFFKDYDSKVISVIGASGGTVISNLKHFDLIAEPEELKGYPPNKRKTIEYFAEFIRDENDRMIGIRFTEQ